jgi:ankyrin repeat protein
LHYAATSGNPQVVQLLLEHYAYIDAESPNGSTPLMMAAMYGSAEAVRVLLDAGADATVKNAIGLTALDFAQKAGHEDAVALIAAAIRANKPSASW